MPDTPLEEIDLRLEDFLSYLHAHGFPCRVDERMRALRVCAAAADRKDRMKTILAPIFARSRTDQERFYQAWDKFFAIRRDFPQGPKEISSEPRPSSSVPPVRVLRPLTTLIVMGLALVLFMVAAIYVFTVGRTPGKPTTLSPPNSRPAQSIELQQQAPYVPNGRNFARLAWSLLGLSAAACPPLLVVCIFFIFRSRWWRHVLQRLRESSREPPFQFEVVPHSTTLSVYRDLLSKTAAAMKRSTSGDESELDVPRTIGATIRQAGFPELRFHPDRKPPQYLFLVEHRSTGDHFARWWSEVAKGLCRLGVSVHLYKYFDDLRSCYAESSQTPINTVNLLATFLDHYVILVGDCRAMFGRYSEFPNWINTAFFQRGHLAILTPSATFEWGPAERRLGSMIPLLAARLVNLEAFAVTTRAPVPPYKETDEVSTIPLACFEETETDAGGDSPSLAMFLDNDVFQWLCACAIYPQIEWNLTLKLGLIIDPSGRIFDEPKLLQLIRLPWFREGRIPGPWRAWLIKLLDEGKKTTVRRELINALEQYPAPVNSFARDQRRLQILAQLYWLEPEDPERLYDLQVAMRGLPPIDVAEDYLLAQMRKPQAGTELENRKRSATARLGWSGRRLAGSIIAGAILSTVSEFFVPLPDANLARQTLSSDVPEIRPVAGSLHGSCGDIGVDLSRSGQLRLTFPKKAAGIEVVITIRGELNSGSLSELTVTRTIEKSVGLQSVVQQQTEFVSLFALLIHGEGIDTSCNLTKADLFVRNH